MGLTGNYILDQLPSEVTATLLAEARVEPLHLGDEIFVPGEPANRVYFVTQGVISIVTEAGNGQAAEGGLVGREGAAGLLEALGTGVVQSRGTVQAPGSAWNIAPAFCRALFSQSDEFRVCVSKLAEFQLVEARQSLLCRSYHSVEERLARWLLEMDNRRATSDEPLHITQDYLALMLAVQRTTVSTAAHALKKRGLIKYLRAKIDLIDLEGLERVACECRKTVRGEEARILHIQG